MQFVRFESPSCTDCAIEVSSQMDKSGMSYGPFGHLLISFSDFNFQIQIQTVQGFIFSNLLPAMDPP